jgi:hypothetical protein
MRVSPYELNSSSNMSEVKFWAHTLLSSTMSGLIVGPTHLL